MSDNFLFETDRLLLRKVTIDDVAEALKMSLDHKVLKYIPFEEEPTWESVKRLITENTLKDYEKHRFGRLAIILKSNMEYIGFTGLKFMEDWGEVDVGYRIKSEYWGLGLTTEATIPCMEWGLKKKGFNRIVAAALPNNKASVRIMEKLGMHFEKTFQDHDHEWVYYAKQNPNI